MEARPWNKGPHRAVATSGIREERLPLRGPPLEIAARLGFGARGLVYCLIGGLALLAAFGAGGGTGGSRTALRSLMSQPFGWILLGLMAVGLLFKVGAAPFHAWTPDVYQGAPTAVTAFMAACTKIAAFGALMRVFYVAFGGASWDWRPLMWVVAILTMVVGSVIAITQTDVKRMLAYSSIAHAGFVLVGFAGVYAGAGDVVGVTSVSSVLFYLAAYGFSTIGAFAIVTLVRDAGGETTALSRWAGLGREAPVLAGTFAFFLLAFAGIPLTSGFIGKWAVFAAAWAGGAWPLVVVAVVMSAVAAFFYVRVIVAMFFSDPVGITPAVAVPSILTTGVITVTALATVALGVVPGPVLDLAQQAGAFVRRSWAPDRRQPRWPCEWATPTCRGASRSGSPSSRSS